MCSLFVYHLKSSFLKSLLRQMPFWMLHAVIIPSFSLRPTEIYIFLPWPWLYIRNDLPTACVEFIAYYVREVACVWFNDVMITLKDLSACYTWSEWTPSSQKMPIGWLIGLKMEATSHMLYWDRVVYTSHKHAVSVFRDPVMPTVSTKFWRYRHNSHFHRKAICFK